LPQVWQKSTASDLPHTAQRLIFIVFIAISFFVGTFIIAITVPVSDKLSYNFNWLNLRVYLFQVKDEAS
jgi:uncharacterized membrane protein